MKKDETLRKRIKREFEDAKDKSSPSGFTAHMHGLFGLPTCHNIEGLRLKALTSMKKRGRR